MIYEFLWLLLRKKEFPLYYFKHIYRRNVTNIFDYVGTKEAARIHRDPRLHKPELTSIMNNKLAFARFAHHNGIKTARLFGYHFGSSYYRGNKIHLPSSHMEMCEYFLALFHNERTEHLFVKPLADYGGHGCFILSRASLQEQVLKNQIALREQNHLFFEVVPQHEEINAIHAQCLNTLRFISYINNSGEMEIISSYIRFGVNDSPVDNAAAGGIIVGVDVQTGILEETGQQKLSFGGMKFTSHPNSQISFGGFRVPFYDQIIDLISNALEHLPDRIIGWDIAITPDGPIIIEANDTPDMYVSDIAGSGILKNGSLKELL